MSKKESDKSSKKSKKPETHSGIEKHSFQAEVQQLLHLMIHSLYSNKEVFLREMISNASDALDKHRYASLTEKSLIENDRPPTIRIGVDKGKRTITVRDNGIGMNHDEVIENIGTIARSGTRQFLEQMSQKKSDDDSKEDALIGQFGVGFYSAFLVSEKVELLTRKAGDDASKGVCWTSSGSGEYTIETVDRPEHGTKIILTLKKDEDEFLEPYRLRSIINKYSDHISLPIEMLKEPELDDNGEPKMDQKPEWEQVNKGSALWARPRNEISDEDYNAFYTSISYDPEPPLTRLHNRVEGKFEYISLFYIPSKAPFDLWDREQRHGIKLYVRRIFIADDSKNLMPNYLRFVRGLVDSADLPLNVSREFLQKNREIDTIKTASVKKILAELTKMAEKDSEKYTAFWEEFGKALKEGIVEDSENLKVLAKLLRFASTHNEDDAQSISLDDYISRMNEKQNDIYFITAENYTAAKSSPHLEIFRKNATEVLLLSDPIDEWVVNHLTEYEGKNLKSIAKGDLDLDDIKAGDKVDKEKQEEKQQELKPLIEKIKQFLDSQVKEVRLSNRLVDSPACLVTDQFDLGGNMERILKSIGQEAPENKPILEINPDHDIVKSINVEDAMLEEWAHVLFDQAALAEGARLKNPSDYVQRVNKLLTR